MEPVLSLQVLFHAGRCAKARPANDLLGPLDQLSQASCRSDTCRPPANVVQETLLFQDPRSVPILG